MIKCLICGKEFNKTGRNQKYCGKECYQKAVKGYKVKWQKDHPEKVKAQRAKYRKNHPEKRRSHDAKYRKEHPEKVKIQNIKWYKEHPEKRKVYNTKHQRELGFNPLNKWFKNSEAHHINNIDVIYIPKNWHFKGHNVIRNRNMEPINTVAFFFLLIQNIDKFK